MKALTAKQRTRAERATYLKERVKEYDQQLWVMREMLTLGLGGDELPLDLRELEAHRNIVEAGYFIAVDRRNKNR